MKCLRSCIVCAQWVCPLCIGVHYMPVRVDIEELKEGMTLMGPIVHEQHVVLPEGHELTTKDLENLARKDFRASVLVADPELEESVRFQDTTHEQRIADQARQNIVRTIISVRQNFNKKSDTSAFDVAEVNQAITAISQFLESNPVTAALLLPHGNDTGFLVDHPANVMYLSLVIGNAVKQFAHERARQRRKAGLESRSPQLDIVPLGLAALFMDISLWSLEEQFTEPRELSDEEREILLRHPKDSADELPDSIDPQIKETIRAHHENCDGTGYPLKLKGNEITLFSRILRVADAYDSATNHKTFKEAQPVPRTLWEMTIGPYATLYDPIILKIFQRVIHPYPIGAKLRLADGRYAVVVRFGKQYGLLPEIVIAFDENNRRLPRKKIEGPFKLDSHPEHRPVMFGNEDLTGIYGHEPIYLDNPPEHPCNFRRLFEAFYP